MDDDDDINKVVRGDYHPSTTTTTAFSTDDSNWPPPALAAGVPDSFLFGPSVDRDCSVLSEFGWNFHADFDRIGSDIVPGSSISTTTANSFPEFMISTNRVDSAVQCAPAMVFDRGDGGVSTSNPSVSSTSSEDRPEISTASGGGGGGDGGGGAAAGGKVPSETAGSVKKKGQKRIRQQRFAFMTKSEVDHLEDGYRWRKYGQKAVKNSPFPRSYYRCTNSKCTVKKRVERSSEDPSTVITTYEGQHCHHIAGFPRGGLLMNEAAYASQFSALSSQLYYPAAQFTREVSLNTPQPREILSGATSDRSHEQQPHPSPQLHGAQGLLGDIMPPGMRNQ